MSSSLEVPSSLPHAEVDRGISSSGEESLPFPSPSPDALRAPTTSSSAPLSRLGVGCVTRFLSADYPLPFAPIDASKYALSFNDKESWPADPMEVFSQWYADAEHSYNLLSPSRMDSPAHWPNTMNLATSDPDGVPNLRTVLLKGFDGRGLVFFTNYEGGKGRELAADPRVAVNFYWKALERQVRVRGIVERLPSEESDRYFHSRPVGSQISGTVSPQSRPIASHTELEEAYVETVVGVAKQVESLLAAQAQQSATSASGQSGEGAEVASGASMPEVEATRARVAKLLSALSEQKGAMQAAHAHSPSSPAHHAADSSSGGNPASSGRAPESSPAPPTEEESAAAVHAHQVALSSLQRLDASPLTSPLLHSVLQRPRYWGGFLIWPVSIEFWCDGAFRLHSRCRYEREGVTMEKGSKIEGNTSEASWRKVFLAP